MSTVAFLRPFPEEVCRLKEVIGFDGSFEIRRSPVDMVNISQYLRRFSVLGMFLGSKYLLRRCLDV